MDINQLSLLPIYIEFLFSYPDCTGDPIQLCYNQMEIMAFTSLVIGGKFACKQHIISRKAS